MVISLYLFGCSQSATRETSSLSNGYKTSLPESLYLSASGKGDTQSEAEKKAITNLSLIFQSKIDVNQKSTSETTEIFSNKDSEYSSSYSDSESILINSNQELINVKFSEPTVNSVGEVTVVAYINRLETEQIYEEKIGSYNSRLNSLIDSYELSNSKFKKYELLISAEKLAIMNMSLINQLNVISPNYSGLTTNEYNIDEIMNLRKDAAKNIVFGFSNRQEPEVYSSILNVLTTKGFSVGDSGDFIINSELSLNEVDLGRKEIFVNWKVKVNILHNELLVISYNETNREGGLNKSQAVSRAISQANIGIKNNLGDKIDQFFSTIKDD